MFSVNLGILFFGSNPVLVYFKISKEVALFVNPRCSIHRLPCANVVINKLFEF